MAFERICFRRLPDGSFRKVYPFHVSLEGMAMSNHGHATILATGQEAADAFKVEWLRMYSQYFSHKYRQKKVLRHTSAVALYLDSDWSHTVFHTCTKEQTHLRQTGIHPCQYRGTPILREALMSARDPEGCYSGRYSSMPAAMERMVW